MLTLFALYMAPCAFVLIALAFNRMTDADVDAFNKSAKALVKVDA